MAILTITGSARKTTWCQVWLSRVALVTGQLGVRLGQGKLLGVPGGVNGAGVKMTLSMTIPTTGIAFPELLPMGIRMTTITMTRLPRIVGTAGIDIAFSVRTIGWMA
jgi:hypothetical protein